MNIEEIVLLPAVAEKLRIKHRVEANEVGEIFDGRPRFRFVEKGEREGEDLYMAFGRTEAGRYLVALFILKQTGEALVISAREMATKDRRWYGKK